MEQTQKSIPWTTDHPSAFPVLISPAPDWRDHEGDYVSVTGCLNFGYVAAVAMLVVARNAHTRGREG